MSDPVTPLVIQSALAAASDEMFAVLKRAAMSPIIYEVLDVGTGVTDADGRLVSSGAGIPTFVGVLDKAVARLLEIHGADGPRSGDVFVTNDPYHGGVTHLSDVVVALPVFARGERVAWAATIAHWSDVGGRTPGSMAADATDIHQEGLRLPAVRLFHGGRLVEPVLAIIEANSRQPDVARGDLWAQVAACRRAEARIRALVECHGLPAFRDALRDALDTAEARVRAGLTGLPRGRFEIEEEQDDGALWRAAVEVGEESFTVDLHGNPAQLGLPRNLSRDGAVIAAQMILKATADPALDANAGSFRPLRVLTEPGTVFHALPPAPHGYYFETRIRLYDLLWRCLAQAAPERLPAGHFGTIFGTVIAGRHPDTGRRFTMVEPQMGGWGATAERDGLDAMHSASHGDTFACPAEIAEARYGVEVVRRALADEAGGAGRHRGGRGVATVYRLRAPAVLSVGCGRSRVPVWGSREGEPGGCNRLDVIRARGGRETHAFASGVPLEPGDEVRVTTASGGGWGRP